MAHGAEYFWDTDDQWWNDNEKPCCLSSSRWQSFDRSTKSFPRSSRLPVQIQMGCWSYPPRADVSPPPLTILSSFFASRLPLWGKQLQRTKAAPLSHGTIWEAHLRTQKQIPFIPLSSYSATATHSRLPAAQQLLFSWRSETQRICIHKRE